MAAVLPVGNFYGFRSPNPKPLVEGLGGYPQTRRANVLGRVDTLGDVTDPSKGRAGATSCWPPLCHERGGSALLVDQTDTHPQLPICGVCERLSAVFAVVEHLPRSCRALVLCAGCFEHRSLTWERYVIQAQVTSLDGHKQSS